jgi:branched-chain amino acid transport system ATP-binding protein
VRDGIAYTFQITSVFPSLSVADNVALAVEGAGRGGQPQPALTAMGLGDRGDARAGSLSYGHQRLLEIAMGLAMAPRLLILDEPAQGLSSGEVEAFKVRIRSLLPDVAILMIEHNMDLVMDLAQRVTVLAAGRVIASGTPGEVRASAAVQEAYLGA